MGRIFSPDDLCPRRFPGVSALTENVATEGIDLTPVDTDGRTERPEAKRVHIPLPGGTRLR